MTEGEDAVYRWLANNFLRVQDPVQARALAKDLPKRGIFLETEVRLGMMGFGYVCPLPYGSSRLPFSLVEDSGIVVLVNGESKYIPLSCFNNPKGILAQVVSSQEFRQLRELADGSRSLVDRIEAEVQTS